MKISILKIKQNVFLKVLGLFGLSFTIACAYGIREETYKENILQGSVKSAMDSSKIKDIKVVSEHDTIITDINGNFTINKMDLGGNNKIDIKIMDIDSTENGHFEDKFLSIIFSPLKEENYTEETIEKDFYLNPKNEN